jgi:hypothetical protein
VRLALGLTGVVDDSEDDEFRGPDWRDADLADQTSVEDVVLRHRRPIVGDKGRFLFSLSEKCAEAPLAGQSSRIVSVTRAQSASSFGSKTTHCVPS